MKKFFESRQNLMSVLLAIFLSLAFFYQFVPFFVPLILASIFALGLESKIDRHRIFRSKALTTLAVLLLFFLAFVAPIAFTIYRIVERVTEAAKGGLQNTEIYQAIERLKEKLIELSASYAPALSDSLKGGGTFVAKAGEKIATVSAGLLGATPDFLVAYLVFMAATYFLIVNSKTIKNTFKNLHLLPEKKMEKLIHSAQAICFGTLLTSVVVGAVQALIVSFGSRIFGYHEWVVVFVITFFFSFIPVIGAGPVAMLLGINCFIEGRNGAGIGLLVVSLIAGTIDNFLKPYILSSSGSREVEVNPIIAIFAFVGAVLVYGIPGLLVGPILTQFTVELVPMLFKDSGMLPPVEPENLL